MVNLSENLKKHLNICAYNVTKDQDSISIEIKHVKVHSCIKNLYSITKFRHKLNFSGIFFLWNVEPLKMNILFVG